MKNPFKKKSPFETYHADYGYPTQYYGSRLGTIDKINHAAEYLANYQIIRLTTGFEERVDTLRALGYTCEYNTEHDTWQIGLDGIILEYPVAERSFPMQGTLLKDLYMGV